MRIGAACFAGVLVISLGGWGSVEATGAVSHVMEPGAPPWFGGTVEQAFEESKKTMKPVLLYWGAIWCPPCNQLKRQVFANPRFLELAAPVISVYLDGDTQAAQNWGEKLKIAGYPTVLLLSPEGTEMMKLGTAVDFEEFSQALRGALAGGTPIQEVLTRAGAGKATPDDWRALAYLDWGQIDLARDEAATLELKQQLADGVPADMPLERARLAAVLLEEASRTDFEAAGNVPALRESVRAKSRQYFEWMLADTATRFAVRSTLSDSADDILPWLHPDPKTPAFEEDAGRWVKALVEIRQFPAIDPSTRVGSHMGEIDIQRIRQPEGPLPEALMTQVREAGRLADTEAKDAYDRHATISLAADVLEEAGDIEGARKLLTDEAAKTDTPWYYQSGLAALEKNQGNTEAALSWSAKARDSVKGRASKLQWAASDVLLAAKLLPQDKPAPMAERLKIFYEIIFTLEDGFAGRNAARVKKIEDAMKPWLAAPEIRQLVEEQAARCGKTDPVAPAGCAEHFARMK